MAFLTTASPLTSRVVAIKRKAQTGMCPQNVHDTCALKHLRPVVAERLQQLSESCVSYLQTNSRAGQPDFAQAGPQRALTGNERRPPGCAAWLGVIVGEHHSFLGDAIDVRRAVAH